MQTSGEDWGLAAGRGVYGLQKPSSLTPVVEKEELPVAQSPRGIEAFDTHGHSLDCCKQAQECLQVKGFCVIDVSAKCEAVDCSDLAGFLPVPADPEAGNCVADGLLGPDSPTEISWLFDHDESDIGSLTRLDAYIGDLTLDVAKGLDCFAKDEEWLSGEHDVSRTSSFLLRVGRLFSGGVSSQSEEQLTARGATRWLRRFSFGKLMAVHFMGPGNGILELGLWHEPAHAVQVSTRSGMLVLLRADLVWRRFRATSRRPAFALGCFATSEPITTPDVMALIRGAIPRLPHTEALRFFILRHREEGLRSFHAEQRGARPPCRVSANACNLPGPSQTSRRFLQGIMHGIDFVAEIPIKRGFRDYVALDASPYECRTGPKIYSKHSSFIDGHELFDNRLFNLKAKEVELLAPSLRIGMEVAYMAAFSAGFQLVTTAHDASLLLAMDSLDGGADCDLPEPGFSHSRRFDAGPWADASRMSYQLKLYGPSVLVDTNGSSSVVALEEAHLLQCVTHRQSSFTLVLGSAWNLLLKGFVSHCCKGLLNNKQGRCFSFDRDAHGFVRAEGCVALVLSSREAEYKAPPHSGGSGAGGLGELRSVGICTRGGRSVTLTSPTPSMMEEAIDRALELGRLDRGDVGVLECNAPGSALFDGAEAAAAMQVLPRFFEDENLRLTATKTVLGNGRGAAALFAIVRVLAEAGLAALGANNHLRELNPSIDLEERHALFVTESCYEPTWPGGLVCVNSFGYSGTFGSAVLWADPEDATWQEVPDRPWELMTWWPAGGGELLDTPRDGYHLAGSFAEWKRTQRMEEREPGLWETEIVLGDNRWEEFQIWLDGDMERVLHPSQARASHLSRAEGPHRWDRCAVLTWLLGERVKVIEMSGQDAHSAVQLEVCSDSRGARRGDRFRVQLQIAGGFRRVSWRNLGPASEADRVLAVMPNFYYVCANWNHWQFDRMAPDPVIPGLWSHEVTLNEGKPNVFYVVRNQDQRQSFYPEFDDSDDPSVEILGPGNWHGHCWMIDGYEATSAQIQFQRSLGRNDKCKLSWTLEHRP